MKRKTLTVICCLAFISPLFSQEDSTINNSYDSKSDGYKSVPLITIKGEEFSKFPTNNFLDAVSGLFPWIFTPGSPSGDYTYVVNGRLLQDINGISLHDIEEVSFTRANMDGKLYPFSQPGIFYIKTKGLKAGKPVVSFNSQYNYSWNKEKRLAKLVSPATTETGLNKDNRSGYLQSNHLSISLGNKKLLFYAGAKLATIKDPSLSQQNTYQAIVPFTINSESDIKQMNAGGFINLTYYLSPSITVGLSANYFHGVIKTDSSSIRNNSVNSGIALGTANSKNVLSYYHVSPYISWKKGRLSNTVYFEYANNKFNYDQGQQFILYRTWQSDI